MIYLLLVLYRYFNYEGILKIDISFVRVLLRDIVLFLYDITSVDVFFHWLAVGYAISIKSSITCGATHT